MGETMKKTIASVVTFFLLCGTAIAAESPTVSINHTMGTVSVPLNPERVVVMDYGSLDTLDALGITAHLAVPKSNLPAYLGRYKGEEYVDVGGLKEFNLETINAFKPGLIVISGRQQDYYKELSAIAPVLLADNLAQDYVAAAKRNIDAVGEIFSAKDETDARWNVLMEAAAAVKAKAAAKNLKALILLTNDGKISAYGSGSRFGIIHDELGVPQADPKIKVGIHGQLVNYEYIAMVNPDIIFVVDRSAAVGGKADGVRLLDNALVAKTNAAKNNRIVALDPQYWYLSGGGLLSLAKMIGDVGDALER